VVGLCLAACSGAAGPSQATPTATTVPNVMAGPVVSVTRAVEGDARPSLAGLDWNTGPLTAVAPMRPPTVRIDADLGEISPGPGVVHLQPLLQKVATIHVNGGVPLVILDYLPAWLGRPTVASTCTSCDPTLVAPQDWINRS
jgi:hypothetical protein